jgi:hypothetical protein
MTGRRRHPTQRIRNHSSEDATPHGALEWARRGFFAFSVRVTRQCGTFHFAPQDGKRGDPMAGMLTTVSFMARATADLLPDFGVIGGKVRMDGPDLCPTGH